MGTETAIHSDLAIPPGEYLEEVLDDLGMTKGELAKRMGRPAPKLSAIFKGDKAITPDTALQLEKVVGVPAHIWTGLEAEYRLTLARQAEQTEETRLQEESSLTTAFCYSELAGLGLVEATRAPKERVRELQRFLGVTSLRAIKNVPRYGLAFRQAATLKRQPSPQALIAWLRVGEREAQAKDCAPFDGAALREALPEIRGMTMRAPDEFLPHLGGVLAGCGVAFVLCPHFPKTYVNGATFWLGSEKAVLMLTIRGKWADIFWFSLFHELGHLLLHGRREMFLEFSDGSPEHAVEEEEADEFAAEQLIPRESYAALISHCAVSVAPIRRFAREVGIHPGIVVGRLQNDGHLQHGWLNKLRMRYEWKKG
ncbi:MAG TPA: HigA family addiction module antidote protein [Candidatus Hydrogenedentes bacterium]|nr:HigA family addiction module antidote protein [Candidatus Hydrogenedentota bacterium]